MSCGQKRAEEDEEEYARLCTYYGEKAVRRASGWLDTYGEHHKELQKRYRAGIEPKRYVVWYEETLRDGRERGAQVFLSIEAALRYMEEGTNGFFGANTKHRLFELGKEIPVERLDTEVPQPPKKAISFRVSGSTETGSAG